MKLVVVSWDNSSCIWRLFYEDVLESSIRELVAPLALCLGWSINAVEVAEGSIEISMTGAGHQLEWLLNAIELRVMSIGAELNDRRCLYFEEGLSEQALLRNAA